MEKAYEGILVASVYVKNKLESEELCALATSELISSFPLGYLSVGYYFEQYGLKEKQDTYCVEIVSINDGRNMENITINQKKLTEYGHIEIKEISNSEIIESSSEWDISILTLETEFKSKEEEFRFITLLANARKFGGNLTHFDICYMPLIHKESNKTTIQLYANLEMSQGLLPTLKYYGEVEIERGKRMASSYYYNDELLYQTVGAFTIN